jgi:hypothetical protein
MASHWGFIRHTVHAASMHVQSQCVDPIQHSSIRSECTVYTQPMAHFLFAGKEPWICESHGFLFNGTVVRSETARLLTPMIKPPSGGGIKNSVIVNLVADGRWLTGCS